jgi:hypothetical protein
METLDINEFSKEMVCEYKGRRYFVRDNGAVYRPCKDDGVTRRWDEQWTLGKFDPQTGYMLIGQERVHRIVCTAYHGEPEGDRNVVDHIDTNRCNNRPENLRWVTKLENTLLNPITRAKVELICGSVEAFLANPGLLYGHESENPNFSWMRAVTKEEGERSLQRWKEWAAKPKEERMAKGERKGPGEWLYGGFQDQISDDDLDFEGYEEPVMYESLMPNVKQLNWKTPTEFLCCPRSDTALSLQAYVNNLEKGKPFTHDNYDNHSDVLDFGINEEENALYVLTFMADGIKHYGLCKIFIEEGFYIHESVSTYWDENGAKQSMASALGQEWNGPDSIDNYG